MKQLITQLRTIGTSTLYRKGERIYFQGEVPHSAIVILDGIVKAYTIGSSGEQAIIHLWGKGSILPIAWANNQASIALFHYEAMEDVRALAVKKHDLHATLDNNVAYLTEYLAYSNRIQAGMLLRINSLCQPRAIEKICYTLYYLSFHHGAKRANGSIEIRLNITQSLLANLIGQTRESTAKNIHILRDAGVLDYDSSSYVI